MPKTVDNQLEVFEKGFFCEELTPAGGAPPLPVSDLPTCRKRRRRSRARPVLLLIYTRCYSTAYYHTVNLSSYSLQQYSRLQYRLQSTGYSTAYRSPETGTAYSLQITTPETIPGDAPRLIRHLIRPRPCRRRPGSPARGCSRSGPRPACNHNHQTPKKSCPISKKVLAFIADM